LTARVAGGPGRGYDWLGVEGVTPRQTRGALESLRCVCGTAAGNERVLTAQGPRRFQTPLDGWPRELEDGSLVMADVFGDLYRVPDPAELDEKSRRLLSPFIG
jgi:hypothetical protein